MNSLLLSLAAGVGLIVAANFLLFRFGSLDAVRNAAIVALAGVVIYLAAALFIEPQADLIAMHLAVYLITSYACGLLLGNGRSDPRQGRSRRKWHWAPLAISGFFVGLVVLNAVFIFLADRGLSPQLNSKLFPKRSSGEITSVFPGVVSHDFHQKESLYNDYLVQLQRQQERGWQIQKGWLRQPVRGQPSVFKVVAKTREGKPLRGAGVSGRFLRPSDSRLDLAFAMQEVEPGTYEASVTLPAAGAWDLVLQVRKDGDRHEVRAATSVAAP